MNKKIIVFPNQRVENSEEFLTILSKKLHDQEMYLPVKLKKKTKSRKQN